MRFRIRTKLIFAISILIIVLFSAIAYLFIQEKRDELALDIYNNTLAFSKLTASNIANNYDLYLSQDAFIYFNREMKKIFDQNDDVNLIKIISYGGEVFYDSELDLNKRYDGALRSVNDSTLLEQIKSENISLKAHDGRVVYLKTDENQNTIFVDRLENPIEPLDPQSFVEYFVVPASDRYSIYYSVDYHNLNLRINNMIKRIVYLSIFGIMLGMIFSFLMAAQLTRPVSKLVFGVEKIAKGDFKTQVNVKTHDELGFLGDAFNRMAKDLDASIDAKLYQERVTQELELATKIQKQIVPKNVPLVAGIEIAADLIPAGEIGGDMYDFISVAKDRLIFYLGDVTGHGVPAGIVSSISSALFYGYSKLDDIKQIMVEVNRVLKAKTMPNMFMTLCLMEWDSSLNNFSFVNAGHEQILHYRALQNDVQLTPSGGIALGMVPDVNNILKVNHVDFNVGDYLVIYSDGIPEAWRNQKESYGMERFSESLKRNAKTAQTALALKDALLADLNSFVGSYSQMDDITILVVKKT